MNTASHLDAASAKGRLRGHGSYLRDMGQRVLKLSLEAAVEPGRITPEERERCARDAWTYIRELDGRMAASLAQAATDQEAVNRQAFAALVHGINRQYMREVIGEAARVLGLIADEKGGA